MTGKRTIAWLLCVVSALLMLASGVFAAHDAHDCAGEDCALCAMMTALEHLRALAALLFAFCLFAPGVFSVHAARDTRAKRQTATLVTLRVKLSN